MRPGGEEPLDDESFELDDDAVFDLIDLDEETERLRRLSVKSSWLLPLWGLLCALGISAIVNQAVEGGKTGALGALLLSLGVAAVILSASPPPAGDEGTCRRRRRAGGSPGSP
ncbi:MULTISPECIES: hypothetical protein [Amycolatopsis]|uniref:hypothetical protein n=1 Tax=Amycolatopsis TaxID=1813 RepID=UPI001C59CC11|nr:hypothetical protein [Amycolatopsis sp. TNS106]QXV55636.1 hypothetical protein CVV72_00430 [Amycolatopsis sp. TNS106]